MQSFTSNNLKVYSLTNENYVPEWLSPREKKRLIRQNPKLQKRIQLIQDLGMPDICTSAQVTADGKYLLATGTYKPRLRCYEFFQNSMKFERGLDYEPVKLIALEEDYSRLVLLQTERNVEFHVASGRHYRTRVPVECRDFDLNRFTADLYFVGTSNDIHRLNMYQGHFMKPFQSTCDDLRCCAVRNDLQILAVGSNAGTLQLWDCRGRDMLAEFPASSGEALTHLKFGPQMKLAVGTETGMVSLFDLRARKPYAQRDHRYGLSINQIEFLSTPDHIASSDRKGVRVWTEIDQRIVVSFEPNKAGVNGFCIAEPGSGLFFVPTESPNIYTYFIPSLGPAPRFCSFLDNIVEQLQEEERVKPAANALVYDNYKFLTRTELDNMGFSSYIGTPLTRPYMHGFLIQADIYERALKKKNAPVKVVEEVKAPIDEAPEDDLPAVNRELFLQFQKKNATNQILVDNRFTALFEDADFETTEDMARPVHHKEAESSDSDQQGSDGAESEDDEMDIRKFELTAAADDEQVDAAGPRGETLASKLRRFAVGDSFVETRIDGEKSFTFVPKSKSKKKVSLAESKKAHLKRRKEYKVRSAAHIIRDLDRPKRGRTVR